ncbi:MAG: LysR family transcriptional regulator [Hydrogenophaga sp.]|nr:LysR family transcriptional regulator [Hydrogenophaga sp.]
MSTSKTARRAPRASRAQAAFRLRVTLDDVIAIGPGKVTLLEAVQQTGSITAAAKSIGMSYRRAWLLLDELNGSLRSPAIESAKGGAAGGTTTLTEVGQEVVSLYRHIEQTAASACATDLRRLLGLLKD